MVVRLRKSITDRPLEKRAERAVGSTWFGPPT
jgi:ribosomal protein L31E